MHLMEVDKEITQADLTQLEKFADRLFAKVGIDVEFTRHFLDRVNDERNRKQITMSELTRLFKQEFKRWGKPIAQMGPDQEAVMKDLSTDINMPFALKWDRENGELDLVAKTVMRKPNFKTTNQEFPVENAMENDMSEPKRKLSPEEKLDIFNKLKSNQVVHLWYDSAFKRGEKYKPFKIGRRTTSQKYNVEKVSMQQIRDGIPAGVKFFLYKRGDNVSLAMGDMGASLVDIQTDMDEGYGSKKPLANLGGYGDKKLAKKQPAVGDGMSEESIFHEDTIKEFNLLKRKDGKGVIKQSDPLRVLDILATRKDNMPHPIKFYDGSEAKVTPQLAKRFMNAYYDLMNDEQRDTVDRYITTKNGFKQAIEKLKIAEIKEAKYYYDGKVSLISKKEFAKIHKDYKNDTPGKERMVILDPDSGATISVPVKFQID